MGIGTPSWYTESMSETPTRTFAVLKRFLIRQGKSALAHGKNIRRHLWKHPFILALLGGSGVILFWRGVWHLADITPVLEHPLVSLLVGIAILGVTGLFMAQLVGQAYLEEKMDDLMLLERSLADEERELAAEERRIAEAQRQNRAIEERIEQELRKRMDVQAAKRGS